MGAAGPSKGSSSAPERSKSEQLATLYGPSTVRAVSGKLVAICPSCHYLQLRVAERRDAQVVDLQCSIPTLERGLGLGYPVRDVEAGGSNPLTPTS